VQGFITDANLELAEEEFPGIGDVYDRLAVKPRTFLQLVWLYLGPRELGCSAAGAPEVCEPG